MVPWRRMGIHILNNLPPMLSSDGSTSPTGIYLRLTALDTIVDQILRCTSIFVSIDQSSVLALIGQSAPRARPRHGVSGVT